MDRKTAMSVQVGEKLWYDGQEFEVVRSINSGLAFDVRDARGNVTEAAYYNRFEIPVRPNESVPDEPPSAPVKSDDDEQDGGVAADVRAGKKKPK